MGIERGGTLRPPLLAATTTVVGCSPRGWTGLLPRRSCSLPRPGHCREHDPLCRCNPSRVLRSPQPSAGISPSLRSRPSRCRWDQRDDQPIHLTFECRVASHCSYPSFQFVSRIGLENEWNQLYKARWACVSDDRQILASFLASLAKSYEVEIPVHSRSDVPWSPFGCSWSEPWGSLEHRADYTGLTWFAHVTPVSMDLLDGLAS